MQLYSDELKRYKQYQTVETHGVICRKNHLNCLMPLHRHDYIEIEYIFEGEIEHELNGVKSVLKKGDCVLLGDRDMHMFRVTKNLTMHNICIDFKTAPEAVKQFFASKQLPVVARLKPEAFEAVTDLFSKLSSEISNVGELQKDRVTAYLILLSTYIFENKIPLAAKPEKRNYKYISEAIKYMHANSCEALTLKKVAQQTHLSPTYFSKLFSDVSGSTFWDYLTDIRIKTAKELLLNTELPITAIAFECGFCSFAAFSRAFKRKTGITPSAYRRDAQTF